MNGCLVMAYGTPGSLDELEAYYTHIRRGRAPEPHLLDELRARYNAIGGVSPLRRITEAQRARIAERLGEGWAVAQGNKHAPPFIEDGVAQLAAAGATRITGVVLAPHFSRASIGEYAARLETSAAEHGIGPAATVPTWADLDAWIDFEARAVADALAALPDRTVVRFTAHSLPERALVDDPYPEQLHASATAIAARAGVAPDRWALAWQSAGRTGDPWRGPDILEVLDGASGRRVTSTACSCARRASRPITSRCCTTSTSRRRSGPRPWASPSAARAASTTTASCSRHSPIASARRPFHEVRRGRWRHHRSRRRVGAPPPRSRRRDHGVRAGAARRQAPHVPVRRSPRRRRRRRLPRPGTGGAGDVRGTRPRRRAGVARHGCRLRGAAASSPSHARRLGARCTHRCRRRSPAAPSSKPTPPSASPPNPASVASRSIPPTIRASARSSGVASATTSSSGWSIPSWAASTPATATGSPSGLRRHSWPRRRNGQRRWSRGSGPHRPPTIPPRPCSGRSRTAWPPWSTGSWSASLPPACRSSPTPSMPSEHSTSTGSCSPPRRAPPRTSWVGRVPSGPPTRCATSVTPPRCC